MLHAIQATSIAAKTGAQHEIWNNDDDSKLQFIERVQKGGREDTIISAGGVSLPGILDPYSDWEMASGC